MFLTVKYWYFRILLFITFVICVFVERKKLCNSQSFFFLHPCTRRAGKSSLHMFYKLLTWTGVTIKWFLNWTHQKKFAQVIFVKFLFATCVIHGKPFSFFTVTGNQHSQHPKKYKKIEKQDDGERDTEDSTVQGSKDRGMELISETVWRKRKKICQKKKMIDNLCENNTAAEDMSHQKI